MCAARDPHGWRTGTPATSDATARVDKLQADGKITADQAAKITVQLPDRITKLVDHVVPAKLHAHGAKPRT